MTSSVLRMITDAVRISRVIAWGGAWILWLFSGACWGLAAAPPWQHLLQQAEALHLSEHPYWLRLLHYHAPGESLGQWSRVSDVQSPSFFLAPEGATDPAAELQATLQAFFEPPGESPDSHAQCRFVARLFWLQEQLDFSQAALPPLRCLWFERWANLASVDSLSVVYVAAYMSNPASLYGHLLLKINFRNHLFGHPLLSPTLNFGAVVPPEDGPITYATKGLFGGYPGRFSDERFYNYSHLYGETELRDLWEYRLRLTPAQNRRVIAHTWEVLQMIDFQYFFLLDNCAYRMAELLDMAWDTPRLVPEFSLWAIPAEFFHRLAAQQDNGMPVVEEVRFLPSRQRRLHTRLNLLPPDLREEVFALSQNLSRADSPPWSELANTQKAQVLDALIDYDQYRQAQEKPLYALAQRQELWLRRSRLPILPEPSFHPPDLVAPTEGAPPTRWRLAGVWNRQPQPALELGVWSSYRDLLGNEAGYLPNAQLVTLDLRWRWQGEHAFISSLTLLDLQSLEASPLWFRWDSGWSWRAFAGVHNRDLVCRLCRAFELSGGLGKAFALGTGEHDIFFALLEAYSAHSRHYTKDYTLGIRPHLGLLVAPLPGWRIEARVQYWQSLAGEKLNERHLQINQRWTLERLWEARLEWEEHRAREVRAALHYSW